MSDLLNTIHMVIRGAHIGLGFVGLALFWLIAVLPKGTPAHLRAGKLFVLVAYAVGGSALFSSLWALVHIDSFAPVLAQQSTPEKQAGLRELFRFLFLILLFLSSATIGGAVYGVRLMRSRERHGELRRTSVPFWHACTLACATALVAFGAFRLVTGIPAHGMLPWAAYQVPLFLGLFGVFASLRELRYVFGAAPPPRQWLFKHVEEMFGTGIAFHTAFVVFGAGRLFGFQISGPWALLPWIGPPVIGVILTTWYVRRLKAASSQPTPPPPQLT